MNMPTEVTIRKPLEGATVTLGVNVTNEAKVRLWLGLRLMRLAVWILGGTVEVK